jgi:hypothetical protein
MTPIWKKAHRYYAHRYYAHRYYAHRYYAHRNITYLLWWVLFRRA